MDKPHTTPKTARAPSDEPLFTVERREVVGYVRESDTGTTDPIVAGFILAAEHMTGHPARFEFEFEGMHYTATADPIV